MSGSATLLVELTDVTRRSRISRENALIIQHGAGRQMIRQLAHEIKNPLGGIRGAAQLLELELDEEELKDYTRVIMKEADRLRNLVNRLLGPNQLPKVEEINIHEVLEMTVEDALDFFRNVPVVAKKLQTLIDVGLSYIHLGQNATTLSGGEAQRVKLAKELSKRDTGNTLYILDEPTTGLHFHDIEQLLGVLHRLRDRGNTIVVIEHNLDVIKTADWIIDLGPEGGDGGGEIIATGTPEDVAANRRSFTGQYLKPLVASKANRKRA